MPCTNNLIRLVQIFPTTTTAVIRATLCFDGPFSDGVFFPDGEGSVGLEDLPSDGGLIAVTKRNTEINANESSSGFLYETQTMITAICSMAVLRTATEQEGRATLANLEYHEKE